MIIVNVIFIAVLSIILIICTKKKNDNTGSLNVPFDKSIYKRLIFAVIILFALVIRIVSLDSCPAGINQDGVMAAVDAKALATYGTDRFGTVMPAHLYAWGYGQMSALLSYMMVPFIKIFGLNVWSMRLPIVIASMGGIIAIYFIAKKLFGEKLALFAMAMTAINPWHFMQSRWALDCNMFPHMFIIGLALLMYGVEKKRYMYISMIFFGLSMYGYGVSFFMVPVFLLAIVIWLKHKKHITIKNIIISVMLYFIISWPEYITMIINYLKLPTIKLPFVTMEYFSDCTRTSDMLMFSDDFWPQLENNLRCLFNKTLAQSGDAIWNSMPDYGTMYMCSIPMMIGGIVVLARDKSRLIYKNIFTIYGLTVLLIGLIVNNVNVNRINIAYYALIIIVVYAIDFIYKKDWKLFIACASVYGIMGICFVTSYFTDYNQMMGNVFYADFQDACQYAKEQNCDYYRITPDTQMPGSYHVTEILTQYLFDLDCKYVQGYQEWDGVTPYNLKFTYGNPYDYQDLEDENLVNVAYIVKASDVYVFPENDYNITFFNEYAVAIKNR